MCFGEGTDWYIQVIVDHCRLQMTSISCEKVSKHSNRYKAKETCIKTAIRGKIHTSHAIHGNINVSANLPRPNNYISPASSTKIIDENTNSSWSWRISEKPDIAYWDFRRSLFEYVNDLRESGGVSQGGGCAAVFLRPEYLL